MIRLTPEQIKKLLGNYQGHTRNVVEGFEGWFIEADKDTGEFFKSYMTDFEVCLYDSDGVLRAIAIGGDYAQDEYHFQEALDFEEVEPETDLIRFNQYLVEISEKALTVGDDLAEINAKLSKITEYVKNLTK